uniref:Phage major capsid protein E n=1 Tax=Candidatus Kentrum sp. LFY TaxID=2126342 RepID=A0A450WGT5_9GAMM|nr:MAG: Phage major capsid protein E [Candidatus Kentron sp. LFY]
MNLNDMFTVTSLTESINKLPVEPHLLESMGLFSEKGVTTTSVLLEERNGRLSLVPTASRNDEPAPLKHPKRVRRTLEVPHLPQSGQLLPSALQNIAPFGRETVQNQQARVINDELTRLKSNLNATKEWHRVGALRGKVLDHDGSVLYDLYEEFDVTKKTLPIPFDVADTKVITHCLNAKRHVESKLQGVMASGYRALCGPDFYDALTTHPNVEKAFANWQAAQDRLAGDNRAGFSYGGIDFKEYNVDVSGHKFIPDNVASLFPLSKGIFRTYNAPANYNQTVNTVGKPYYAKAERRKFDKGWDLESQANPLTLCFLPETLVELVII